MYFEHPSMHPFIHRGVWGLVDTCNDTWPWARSRLCCDYTQSGAAWFIQFCAAIRVQQFGHGNFHKCKFTIHKCFHLLFAVAILHDWRKWRRFPRQFNKLIQICSLKLLLQTGGWLGTTTWWPGIFLWTTNNSLCALCLYNNTHKMAIILSFSLWKAFQTFHTLRIL